MKNSINSLLKIVLVVTFFCSAAFADGDMSNGGRSCTGSSCPGFAAGHNQGDPQTTTGLSVNASDETEISAPDFIENFLISFGLI